jgi:hypothetical protein
VFETSGDGRLINGKSPEDPVLTPKMENKSSSSSSSKTSI